MKKIFFVVLAALLMPDAFSQSKVSDGNNRFENRKKKGYYNITQIGLLTGTRKLSEQNNYYNYTQNNTLKVTPSVAMTNGCMFNEHWAAGVGVGYEIFEHSLCPVFMDIRYIRRDHEVSPFFAFKIGYAIGNLSKKHYDDLYLDYQPYYIDNAYFKNDGGLMLHPEMGVKFPLSEKADLLFSVAYRYQKLKTSVSQSYGMHNKWEHQVSMNRLSFGAAVMFR
jgi:hypothetical protein